MIGVIATKQNYDRFLDMVNGLDMDKFRWFGSIDSFRGLEFDEIIRIGSYHQVKNHQEIYEMALTTIRRTK